jgi:kumamolisin
MKRVQMFAFHHRFARATVSSSWSVPDLCKAYQWPTRLLQGGGTIAIVELGGGWSHSDMQAYFASIGQPVPTINDVSVDGTQNTQQNPQDNADFEVALDIQVAAAAYFCATGKPATIRVYWAQDIATAVTKAAQDSCAVCSISWGADEASWGKQAAQDMDAAAAAAVKAGMVVFAASGDNDSSDGGPGAANVDAPASCPHVIGCGGTRKTAIAETVWNDNPNETNGEGTGGGYSTLFPKPAWQSGISPLGVGRMVPDVSANADPVTGYQIVVYGQTQIVGGTSAVAPLYAGLFAALGKGTKLGFITPWLWRNQNCFTDITQGNNGEYSATEGPDPCSGLGSLIAVKLAASL